MRSMSWRTCVVSVGLLSALPVLLGSAASAEPAQRERGDGFARMFNGKDLTVKPDDWNEYRILAEGRSITLWINGVLMCQVEDHQEKFALPRGIIALQMHQGPPMKVEFKDLRIRIIKSHD